jgi:hypothetical protein
MGKLILISKRVKGALLALLLTLPWNGYSEELNEHQLREKAIARLDAASQWIIEDGVNVFSRSGKDGLHRMLIDEWAVGLWVHPAVESDGYLAMFRIKARRIRYAVHNLYREEVNGKLYEFWLVKKVYEPETGEGGRSVFYVSETEEPFGHRKILKKSDQFFDAYQVDNENVIKFPKNNLRILYDMEAWRFPDSYKKSELKDFEIFIDSNGEYKARKIIPEQKI